MKKAFLGWKLAALLVSIIAAAAFAGSVMKGSAVLSSLALLFAALGAIQYAFGWPNIPRNIWRVFGPIFSTLMVWSLARSIGWLGTRLAIRPLPHGKQAVTLTALIVTAAFGAIVCIPLFRLGQWRPRPETIQ